MFFQVQPVKLILSQFIIKLMHFQVGGGVPSGTTLCKILLCGLFSRASVENHLDRPLEVPNIVVTLCSNDTEFYVR